MSAATARELRRGGHTRTIRCAQRHQPCQPPVNIVDSAALTVFPARHFGGKYAIFANIENITLREIFNWK